MNDGWRAEARTKIAQMGVDRSQGLARPSFRRQNHDFNIGMAAEHAHKLGTHVTTGSKNGCANFIRTWIWHV
jgi:hypothetical protein